MNKKITAVFISAMLVICAAGCSGAKTDTASATTTTASTTTTEATPINITTSGAATPSETETVTSADTEASSSENVPAAPDGTTPCGGERIKAFYDALGTDGSYFMSFSINDAVYSTYFSGDAMFSSISTEGSGAYEMLVKDGKSYTIIAEQRVALMSSNFADSAVSVPAVPELDAEFAGLLFAEGPAELNGTACTAEYLLTTDGEAGSIFYFDGSDRCIGISYGGQEASIILVDYGSEVDETIFNVPADYRIIDMENLTEDDYTALEGLYTE